MTVSFSFMKAYLAMLSLYAHLMRIVGAEILHSVIQLFSLETRISLVGLSFIV